MDLTCRELRCGKLKLALEIFGYGDVFALGKPGKSTQRKLWHGEVISDWCVEPPKPVRQASPEVLPDLYIDRKNPMWFSKRDAKTFFDVLEGPEKGKACSPELSRKATWKPKG